MTIFQISKQLFFLLVCLTQSEEPVNLHGFSHGIHIAYLLRYDDENFIFLWFAVQLLVNDG